MKLAEKRSRSLEKSIVNLQRGRPLLLGNDIDEKARKYRMTFFFFFYMYNLQNLQSPGTYISKRTWDPGQKAITK